MKALKKYLMVNFEAAFVLITLLSIVLITYFIPQKIAFLNFFYIPVLMSAYYLGIRAAVLGAVLTALIVAIYAIMYPAVFFTLNENIDLAVTLITWACFLVLTAIVVARLTDELKQNMYQAAIMQHELSDKQDLLEKTTVELKEFTQSLDEKVAEKTDSIEKSRQTIEKQKQKVEDALYSTMDPSVVKLIIEKRLRTEKRHISVMFSDLKGFTQYTETQRAEVVVTNLNRYLADMETVLLEYGAHIDKYMGDGIMVEFGAPIDYEQYALQAVMCGHMMQRHVKRGDYPWSMRIGIATGESIIGLTGHKRQSYTTLGDTVNLAARIEDVCTPERVTVDEVTYKATARYFNYVLKSEKSDIEVEDNNLKAEIADNMALLDHDPNNFDLIKKTGHLYLKANNIFHANELFEKALRLNPSDDDIKITYAETAVKAQNLGATHLRGKRQPIRLYELDGIKDPLLDKRKIPGILYDEYYDTVNNLVEYPEELLLPNESIEGSIGHSRVVGFLSYILADKLKLAHQDKIDILHAGYYADFGKSIISHHILNRRGTLSPDELEFIKSHPEESVRKLRLNGYDSQPIFDAIITHHEYYTGGGYPNNLSADDIPVGGRIIALAEAYSSLTSWRPYRERWDKQAAINELEKDTEHGKYDPQIMSLLSKLLS